MNYRHGLQRVYAVLTVAWIAGVMFAVLTGRWEPWLRLKPAPKDWTVVSETKEFSPSELRPIVSPEAFFGIDNSKQRWEWAVGLSLVAPAVLYLLLFYVSRWVYRGFTFSASTFG